jgi:hypothetical protein
MGAEASSFEFSLSSSTEFTDGSNFGGQVAGEDGNVIDDLKNRWGLGE